MPNILLTRIDNRLVHGQVGCSWVGAIGCNLIVVADDEAAGDPVQQSLMKMTADSTGVGIRFFTLQKTIEVIHKAAPSQKIFIVVRNPRSARALVEGGVPIDKLCIGNMHVAPGKKVSNEPHVYLDEQDLEDLRLIRGKGIDVYIQIAPGDKKHDFEVK
ncbi:PTS galactosamine transporter subunit IIB [Lacrimispora celerecrescens]|uniref:PTS system, galactosamine-specific IIB component n=1 Tax=[Clostridium] celerecrescens 18A TaxID=1286362 RepID=A0A2M8ZB86_9FIRM|nr:PTS galactosamine transporter subunit IIB [Lacrimispora celerecrescens]PJJ30707.1 PTS system, galactosamine-specific IIB component [[Clostridium] celerecrescens 18A]